MYIPVVVYIYLWQNDGEFEFDAGINYTPGRPAKIDALPEDCYPEEPAEAEYEGPDIFDLVLAACWIHNVSMTTETMQELADEVLLKTIEGALNER